MEAGPHVIEAEFERVRAKRDHAVEGRDRRLVLMRVRQHAALIRSGGPRCDSAFVAVPRSGRQQAGGGLEIGEDQLGDGIGASSRVGVVGLPIVAVGREVVGNVAPHPPQLEVIMRAQEEGFSQDSDRIGVRDCARFRLAHLL